MAFDQGSLDLNAVVKIRFDDLVLTEEDAPEGWTEGDTLLFETTLGRALFNELLPVDYPYENGVVDKKRLSVIVNDLAERYPKVEVAASLDALKEAGFRWATRSGVTISISDVATPAAKAAILEEHEGTCGEGAGPVREGPDHRRRASSGAHRDLDAGHRQGRQGDAGELPAPATPSTRWSARVRVVTGCRSARSPVCVASSPTRRARSSLARSSRTTARGCRSSSTSSRRTVPARVWRTPLCGPPTRAT